MFGKDLQLICWNRQFGEILDLPPHLLRVGSGLADILHFNGTRSDVAPDKIDEFVQAQIERYVSGREPFLERFAEPDVVIEVRANHMPDGGIATSFTDITPSVEAAEALERANETLEIACASGPRNSRAQRRTGTRQRRSRRRQSFQDQIPGGGSHEYCNHSTRRGFTSPA